MLLAGDRKVDAQVSRGAVGDAFSLPGTPRFAEMLSGGHLHATWMAGYRSPFGLERYIHQRINIQVFRDPGRMMDNIRRVTEHLRRKLENGIGGAFSRQVLLLVPTRDGEPFWRDTLGGYWRTYRYVEGSRTFDTVETPDQARKAAAAFGEFAGLLSDLPGPRLHETIPDFHNTPARLRRLLQVVEVDPHNRAGAVIPHIDFVLAREVQAGLVHKPRKEGEFPERIVHNDTKINNVLFHARTGEVLCLVDLDTVMPGSVLYDFGDLVRTGVCPAREGERNLSRVEVRLPVFEALVRGYLEGTGGLLTAAEVEFLAFSARLITLELGIRFLTDYLEGDIYFRAAYPEHNLDRCRHQFRLLEELERQYDRLEALVKKAR